MLDRLIAFYPHRRNRDGSFDSICLHCFATIATANTERELVAYESKHICRFWKLSQQALDRRMLEKTKTN